MYRKAYDQLLQWKNKQKRKPLILKGARQVGKSWLMEEFGRQEYKAFFKFNFDKDEELSALFRHSKDAHFLIEQLGILAGQSIEPEKHLLIFDEIQECPEALGALKYFCEDAPEYHIVAAGSLLGTLLAQPQSYPVGKVNILPVFPMSFGEFLQAAEPSLADYFWRIEMGQAVEGIFHERLLDYYRKYLIVGGMPECVAEWIDTRDAGEVASIQDELIALYENDFSKHNGKVNAGRILMVFRSIVTQLAKENEKFLYGCVRPGARAREFEEAIEWLVSSGVLLRVYDVTKPLHPIKTYEDLKAFKLFLLDVGLLKRMAGIGNDAILLDKAFQFSGALAENFVLQQMQGTLDVPAHYFSPTGAAEIDFILQAGTDIVPIEVKAAENVRAKSFKEFIKKYHPQRALRLSRRNARQEEVIWDLPIYLAERVGEWLNKI